jgi:hypothetical protein
MSGDRHKGEPRCLHPQAQRAVTTNLEGARVREQCLDCRAVRFRKLVKHSTHSQLRWGPWVGAGEQVKQALLAKARETRFDLGAGSSRTVVVNVQLPKAPEHIVLDVSLKLEDK